MNLSSNKKYLIISFFSWILLFFFTLTTLKVYRVSGKEDVTANQIKYVISEGFACSILAYLVSLLIALYVDKYLDFKNIKRKDIFKLIGVFIGAQVLYSLLIWPILMQIDSMLGNYAFDEAKMPVLIIKLYNIPFFATLFFIWLFVYITIKMYHQLKNVQLKQLSLETNLKESQLNTLKGQINPHFMFNSLNNIRGLMLENVPKSRNMITRLSEMLRYSLTKNDVHAIELRDELEMVDNYIEISKIQMEDRLTYTSKINTDLLSKQIPPMLIQILIENAIKHGISKLKEGGLVHLEIQPKDEQLEIKVHNSGKLCVDKSSTQLGLKNVKQRLSLLYKDKANFSLKEVDDMVVATIQIPL